jgi:glycosyltransferase involved in cell wall biosynthesis
MNIAVNVRLLKPNQMTGIGVFTQETMCRLVKNHPEHTFYYIFDEQAHDSFLTSSNIIPVVTPFKSRHRAIFLKFWFEYVLSKTLKKINADVLISPDGFMSLSTPTPTLIVIHDINFEHYPGFIPPSISKFYRKYTPLYASKARRIATVSDFSRNDIAKTYGIDHNKIDVVYNGANVSYSPISVQKQQQYRNQHTMGLPFFIFVGMIHPRKNLANQLKAFDLFRKSPNNPPHKFYIVGKTWILDDELKETLSNMEFSNDVIFAGRLSSEDLGFALASASAVMYVSHFEGFGIPILEGFYAETPVITSNTTSMPEVAGDAAICVSPNDILQIETAMNQIVHNTQLKQQLIAKGRERKLMFTWSKTSELLWQSIEKMLQNI